MHAEFDVTLRPYTLNDCTDVYEAVRESLRNLFPGCRGATLSIRLTKLKPGSRHR